jgi:hypothetical protein
MTQTKYMQRAGNTWRKHELIPLNPYGQESHRLSHCHHLTLWLLVKLITEEDYNGTPRGQQVSNL